jgi:hypothetical protein
LESLGDFFLGYLTAEKNMAAPDGARRSRSLDGAEHGDGSRFQAVLSELESRLESNKNDPAKSQTNSSKLEAEPYCHRRHHSAETDATGSDSSTTEDEKTDIEAGQVEESAAEEEPYHVFTRKKKWELVLIVSLAGLFSPLSSNIYFPALGAIAEVCLPSSITKQLILTFCNCQGTGTSLSHVSLTVTIYMVVQGIAPSFWGPLSDARGRRITFVGTFVVYLIANISLALSKDFASMMVSRALQAAGSAATISVGSCTTTCWWKYC